MTRALSFLLLGCLLEDVFGNPYKVTLPQTVEAVTGSCLTIPCSFEVDSKYEKDLNDKCKAVWKRTNVMNIKNPNLSITKDMVGDLTMKNCTSTFTTINSNHSGQYYFRLECTKELSFNFKNFVVKVNIRDLPPPPTLTPSALTVKEGTSVSLTCSAPASCPSHPPTLTWTPKLADSQETLKENQDQTKVQISVLNFTASHLHHGKNITCTAVYWKQDGSSVSLHSSLTADIKFPPKILPLTNCTKTEVQVNCSCETEGIPSPALYWFLDGLPVNESENLKVKTESEIDTNLRSIITVTRPQKRNPFILLCFSVNSLGSASQQFLLTDPPQQEQEDPVDQCQVNVVLVLLITTTTVLLLLVCFLLAVIRFQMVHNSNYQRAAEAASVQLLTRRDNEVTMETDDNTYANIDEERQEMAAHSAAVLQHNNIKMSEEDTIYSKLKHPVGS